MGTSAGMLVEMRALIGLGEYPPGSNHNKVTEWYGAGNMAWCDATVSYAAAKSDNAAVIGKFSWTVAHARWFQGQGRWHYGLGGIRAGDIIFFDWSGSRVVANIDHVGVVEAVHSDGTVTTIEGNTSDVCARRVRNSDYVVGYGRPAYTGAKPLPTWDGILRRGAQGTAVRTLQERLNRALNSHLVVDGAFGSATEAALIHFQALVGIVRDGEYGPASSASLDSYLSGKSRTAAPLVVDGLLGALTIRALQRALNAHGATLQVDGELGPRTARALQAHVGARQDGAIGTQTVKALQRHVGATPDGDWGRATTAALQRKLNAGTF